jgi:hypothetical protein
VEEEKKRIIELRQSEADKRAFWGSLWDAESLKRALPD